MRDIAKKVQERRLQWHGHVVRRYEEYVWERVMGRDVEGWGRKE